LAEDQLKKKIGQMLMVGFRGTEVSANSYIATVIKDLKVGGIILFDYDVSTKSFSRNIINPNQTKKLISDLQSYAAAPLLIAVDAEGGSVNRLKSDYGFSKILSAKEMGQSIEITIKESEKLATELKELGFNMNLAPVVDVDINPNNPIIGGLNRSFSSDPNKVITYAAAFIKAHHKKNIITVEKHFPGHGSSTGDSHLGMVDVTDTYQEKELTPYRELQKEGLLDVVMTAHIINRNIDENYPATLSSNFLQKILRQQIGFRGVIISDDLNMNAIVDNYGFEETIIKAVNSGCDILLISNNSISGYDEQLPYKARDIIYEAVKSGKIPLETITESYNRIYNLKKKFGII
jgi:beta-N-acetylhexosaminidase